MYQNKNVFYSLQFLYFEFKAKQILDLELTERLSQGTTCI